MEQNKLKKSLLSLKKKLNAPEFTGGTAPREGYEFIRRKPNETEAEFKKRKKEFEKRMRRQQKRIREMAFSSDLK